MLLALVSHSEQSFTALLYYALTYALTTIGAFGVVAVVEAQTGSDKLSDFSGLRRRAPVLSFCMLIFLLSLAGIPPLAGFFGKFYLFTSTLAPEPKTFGLFWLVILAIAMSAVSLYYYLQVLKRIYIADPPIEAGPIRTPIVSQIVICLIAFGVVLLGCAPNILLAWLQQAIQVVSFEGKCEASRLVFRNVLVALGNLNHSCELLSSSYISFDLSNSQSSCTTAPRLQPGANRSLQNRLKHCAQLDPPLSRDRRSFSRADRMGADLANVQAVSSKC